MLKRSLASALFALVLAVVAVSAACSGSSGSGTGFVPGQSSDGGPGSSSGGTSDATVTTDSGGPSFPANDGSGGGGDANEPLLITPGSPTIPVTLGATPSIPTQQFTATYGGASISPQWTIDRGEIGTIGVSSGLLTPTALLGGAATVTATYQGHIQTATVTVDITNVAIGDPNPPDAGAGGTGGYGGVGGSGEGAPANGVEVGLLNNAPTADANLGFLYPYNQTVFPQGILAPLLQWTTDGKTFDAVLIDIKEAAYEYKGYFQAPSNPFQNHPIPQAIWDAIAYSNQGEDVTVSLTFAVSSQNQAWGPISRTLKIAQGSLKGTIYYSSYGTNLAHNVCCALDPGGSGQDTGPLFGGATLAIHEDTGATSPVLIAGSDSDAGPQPGKGDQSGCRVCHTVASGGSTLLTQRGDDYTKSVTYALGTGNAQTAVANNNDGRFNYPAVSPDGTMIFSHEGTSALYKIDGTSIPSTGIPSGMSAFLPAFSPDSTHIAFAYNSNPSVIASIDFVGATAAFSNLQTLATPTVSGTNAYWPSYLPTNTGIVYQVETVSNGRDTAGTRSQCDAPTSGQGGDGKSPDPSAACHSEGTHSELWWVDVATKSATRLDQLNGKGYVPPHASYTGTSGDDSTLNYEPTVNPVPSGGYAWVVFTSRRMYGNVATVNPFWSDPRFEDISKTPTTKKLWVAAIDLNATPGKDPSHPAFYLPAQELLAGNSRGFWVVDPCQADGTSCTSGDQCCGGYCRPGSDGGLMCTATQPSCSQQYEKCTTNQQCCGYSASSAGSIQCIDGLCSLPGPR